MTNRLGEWNILLPLVRPALRLFAGVLLALLLAAAVLWGTHRFVQPDWLRAAPAEQAAQAAQAQLEQARADRADVQSWLPRYRQLEAAGLIGGEPRAAWVEDLLRAAQSLGLQEHTSFTLAAPEVLALPEAADAHAQVERHVLDLQMVRVHELEVLRLLDALRAQHGAVQRVEGCVFEDPKPEGLSARCRIGFLHIRRDEGAPADGQALQ
ncbi:hypothetical protein [Melaminivora sp.]|uniref:hypothetical protein n=1 Tax=Melaminivora sp. TaxID=1933032 RepID=UPI0028A9516A|nr:hypothetical protein [Melaminivora sp.]